MNEKRMELTSSAFAHNGTIPSRYTCDGERNLNPPLSFSGVPKEAVSLTLIIDDPDVPKQLKPNGVFDHWILFNIPPSVQAIPEGGSVGVAGANSAGKPAYTGPCPPREYEPKEHRYIFTLYALDTDLSLGEGATKEQVLAALTGHVLEQAQLTGRYQRAQ